MRYITAFLFLFVQCHLVFAAETKKVESTPECELTYVSQSDLTNFRSKGAPITTLSRSINEVLKTSFNFLNAIDSYTLGIASALTLGHFLGTNVTLEDMKPNQWNQVVLTGSLVYRDSPFTVVPLKGTKISVQHKKKKETLTTGAKGEYAGYLYKWVPFDDFRIYVGPDFFGTRLSFSPDHINATEKLVKKLDIPFKVTVHSKICQASAKIYRLPLEPITFILSAKK